MELQLGPEIISSYKRLSYTIWYALAEFVDNSTQAYFNNSVLLDNEYLKDGHVLTVTIESGVDKKGDFIRVSDNSIGMSKKELENAVIVGRPPKDTTGRSKYGLGLKTGACWFGDWWTIETKKFGDTKEQKIIIDVEQIATGNLDLHHKEKTVARNEHYTIIEIRKLHRKLVGRTTGKVKDYLRSIYRRDLSKAKLRLKWNTGELKWDYKAIDERILLNKRKERVKREFRFIVGGKKVHGWAGVFEKGSRKDAGFTIIQADRVVTGWPNSYRPETLFGVQEGGSNDLVNQRLVGEIYLEGFDVSHTKDEILFEDGEKEALEYKLQKELADLRQLALSYRKYTADERTSLDSDPERRAALNDFDKEIRSNVLKDFLATFEIPSPKLTAKNNTVLKESIVQRFQPSLKVTIDKLTVHLYLVKEMSPNDPYVIIESTKSKEAVVVIINLAHPHWLQLTNQESIRNFIRHCTYDGVAEWKTYLKTGKIEPDTVKLIKDNLLRIPLLMEKSSS